MSQLRSILEELVAFDPNDLSTEELAAEIAEASHGQQILQTAVAGWVKNLADRGGHHTLGYSSPTALLVDQTRVSPGHARRIIGYGNAGEKAPPPSTKASSTAGPATSKNTSNTATTDADTEPRGEPRALTPDPKNRDT